MGNRAVITTRENFNNDGVGVYLHWNGGRDSVQAFLTYCKMKGYREPTSDNYGWARLCQVIGNFFGGGFLLGLIRVVILTMITTITELISLMGGTLQTENILMKTSSIITTCMECFATLMMHSQQENSLAQIK